MTSAISQGPFAISPDSLPMVVQADHIPGPAQGHWTYDDYAKIPDDGNHYEVIEGVLYMAPAPLIEHQGSSGEFFAYLREHVTLKGLGRVYYAPVDVVLGPKNTVQPDLLVILKENASIVQNGKVMGAPDLVIEIASPGTSTFDRTTKLTNYQNAGIKEYWIADRMTKTVEVFTLNQGKYVSLGMFQGQSLLPSKVVPNLPVKVEQFFA